MEFFSVEYKKIKVEDFLKSNMSLLEYSKKNNIDYWIFWDWVKRYRRSREEGLKNSIDVFLNKSRCLNMYYSSITEKDFSKEEEKILFQKAQNGDEEAFLKLFNSFLHLPILLVCSLYDYGYDDDFDDVFIKSMNYYMYLLKRYDCEKGKSFSSYYYHWNLDRVIAIIFCEKINCNGIKDQNYDLYRYILRYKKENGCYPPLNEVKEMFEITSSLFDDFYRFYLEKMYLEDFDPEIESIFYSTPTYNNGNITLNDELYDDLFIKLVNSCGLSEREKEIIIWYYNGGSLAQYGRDHNLTRSRIQSIYSNGLEKIKNHRNTKRMVKALDKYFY